MRMRALFFLQNGLSKMADDIFTQNYHRVHFNMGTLFATKWSSLVLNLANNLNRETSEMKQEYSLKRCFEGVLFKNFNNKNKQNKK